jgi:hypothetical protein
MVLVFLIHFFFFFFFTHYFHNCLSLPFHIQSLVSCDISFAVAFDEDFEGELADNFDARSEVSLLAKSADPELSEVSYKIYKVYVVI